MNKLIVVLMLFSMSVFAEPSLQDFGPQPKLFDTTDIVNIQTTSFSKDGSLAAIEGDVIGLEYAPSGDYRVRIVNGSNFKGERFSLMLCNVKKYLEDIDETMTDAMALSTAFTDKSGKVHNVIGYYSGTTAYPSENYKVIIVNSREFWNSMNCRIK